MASMKVILSESDSDASTSPAHKAMKISTDRKSSRKTRTGKGAKDRREEKNRMRINELVFRNRVASCRDPQHLYMPSANPAELERKFLEWDRILADGGTIFDSGETGGAILIETEDLDDVTRARYDGFMHNRAADVTAVTYYDIPSDEADDDTLSIVASASEFDSSVVEEEPTDILNQSCPVDYSSLPAVQVVADLSEPSPLLTGMFFDLSSGELINTREAGAKHLETTQDVVMDEGGPPPIKVRFQKKDHYVSREGNGPFTFRPTTPILGVSASCAEPVADSAYTETLDVEIYRRFGDQVLMWHSGKVRRVTFSGRVKRNIQFHPLTRTELFHPWKIKVCVYRLNSQDDYVRDIVQVNRS